MCAFEDCACVLAHVKEYILFATTVSLCAGFLLESISGIANVFLSAYVRILAYLSSYVLSITSRFSRSRIKTAPGMPIYMVVKLDQGKCVCIDAPTYRQIQFLHANDYYKMITAELDMALFPDLIERRNTPGQWLNCILRLWIIGWTVAVLYISANNQWNDVYEYIKEPFWLKKLSIYVLPNLFFFVLIIVHIFYFIYYTPYKQICSGAHIYSKLRIKRANGEFKDVDPSLPLVVGPMKLKKNRFSVCLKLFTWKTRKMCKKTIGACSEFIGRLPRRWKH